MYRFLEGHKNIKGLSFNSDEFFLRTKSISVSAPDDDSETDTGESLPEDAIVYDVFLDVKVAESTGTGRTLDVGTDSSGSGDADGFLDGVDVSSTGRVKGTLADSGVTLGELLYVDTDGSSDNQKEPYIYGTDNVTITADNDDWEEFKGEIVFVYATN